MTRMYAKRDDYSDEKRKQLTNGFFILNCLFNRQSCGQQNFTQYYSYLYGNCIEFNRDLSNIKQTIAKHTKQSMHPSKHPQQKKWALVADKKYNRVVQPIAAFRGL